MLRHALLALAFAAAADGPAGAPSADEVIARSVAARGGLARIRAVRSVRMTGRIAMGEVEAPITVEIRRPSSFRSEMLLEGRPVVQAYDGHQAWTISPMGGGRAEALPTEAARQMEQQADLEGALVDYAAKGSQVELVGKEQVDGAEAWRIRLTHRGGDVEFYLVDARSFLPVRVEATRHFARGTLEGETTIGDYRDSGGWKWPHTIVNAAKGLPQAQKITFQTIEVDPELDDARFRMPGTRTPAPAR
jgi:outer membrane lipoprotein-sorting protein